ncbi:FAD/NAD(P)-binding oxidoreductase [Microbacterium kribbense]|uniref:FAD/NAD(P)-binding oxidoreductase n=1 Tax=Microbacterium kribbense TaxID=433645 RepID=A0ABP7GYX2_9MICO
MFDVVVIGAGPAGMAAAAAAADHGLSVALIDEQQRVGGQIFRQPPTAFTAETLHPTAGYRWSLDLIADIENRADISWMPGTTALGILRDRETTPQVLRVAVSDDDGGRTLATRRILIATGAYDLPVAVPGWTLPGVFMAGAAQTLAKSQKFVVSDRVVLAGSHPLLIIVADLLRRNGVDVAEVALARGIPGPAEVARSLAAIPGHVGMFTELGAMIARLVAAGTRFSTRTVVTNVHGDDRVKAVDLTRVNRAWQPTAPPRQVDTSALVLGYGFLPSTELARQAACAVSWDSPKGGWVVDHDQHMRTSVPDIFVAGEPTGVAGADQSRAEGMLAGLSIAQDLGASVPSTQLDAVRRALAKSNRFSKVVQNMFAPNRGGLTNLATADTLICRCERITRGRITTTLGANPHLDTASALKLECRSGMGPCQGRYCENTVTGIIAATRNTTPAQIGRFSSHFPVKPVPVSVLSQIDD